jgi:hypothetical protein
MQGMNTVITVQITFKSSFLPHRTHDASRVKRQVRQMCLATQWPFYAGRPINLSL